MKTLVNRFGPICIATLLLAPIGVFAQQAPAQPNREELDGMMDAYILSKLQDALDLTDEQYGRMVVAQKKLQDLRRDYRRKRMELLRQMRQELGRDGAEEEDLQSLLDELEGARSEFLDEEQARYRAIDAILDIRQRARYRILEAEIQRRLVQLMRQVRRPDRPERQQPFP